MAAATVKLPGVGQVPTKYVWAGGAAVAGVAGYAWWRAGSSGGGSAPAIVDPALDPAGLAGDPASGGGYINPAPAGAVPDPTAGSAPTTNAEWSAAATDALERVGFETAFIGSTLGKYLDHRPLTTAEAALVRVAWAYVGRPPEGSYPIVAATTPPTTTPPTVPPKPPAKITGPHYTRGWHAVGVVGRRYPLRDLAKLALPSNNQSPNAVEAKLRAIVAHPNNKTLRDNWGPTTKGRYSVVGVPGGMRIYFP